MISLKATSCLGLLVPLALLSTSAQGDHGKKCGDPCGRKVSRCAETRVERCAKPCARVERCADPCPKVKCAKGDIENLNASLPACSQELTISYDVEIDYAPAGTFNLLVDVINNGERIHQITIPLDNGSDGDDDEMEFKGSLVESLPAIGERCNLRVEGNIVPRAACMKETVNSAHGRSLDRKITRVDIEDEDRGFVGGVVYESTRFVSYPVRAFGGETY